MRSIAIMGMLLIPFLGLAPKRVAGVANPNPDPGSPVPWGAYGHGIASKAALRHLPGEMPAFFRSAEAQLVYLGPEPDRWRSRELKEMDDAWEFDHYIDLENVPEGALDAPDRYEFIAALYAAGILRPQQFVGFLPWRILEVYQRIKTELAIWRTMEGDPDRPFVEARILNDAGILGHYVADAAQPHHTTIHFNGWAESVPNPDGFTMARDFHSRFESAFVEAHVTFQDVDARMAGGPIALGDPREAIWAYVNASNETVKRQYQLERDHGFDPEAEAHPMTREFVIDRLTAGAEMLRALWWAAWIESEPMAEERQARGWSP
jgi:hypothetical protein